MQKAKSAIFDNKENQMVSNTQQFVTELTVRSCCSILERFEIMVVFNIVMLNHLLPFWKSKFKELQNKKNKRHKKLRKIGKKKFHSYLKYKGVDCLSALPNSWSKFILPNQDPTAAKALQKLDQFLDDLKVYGAIGMLHLLPKLRSLVLIRKVSSLSLKQIWESGMNGWK